jgi:hypothetical protein
LNKLITPLKKYQIGGAVQSSTRVAPPPVFTLEDLEELALNKQGKKSERQLYLDYEAKRDRQKRIEAHMLSKGQTPFTNNVSDFITALNTELFQFRFPTAEELEKNRGDVNDK